MNTIFKEVLHKGLKQEILIKKVLVNMKSKYQKIQVFDTLILWENVSFRRNNTSNRKR